MPNWLDTGLGKSQPQAWDLGEYKEGTRVLKDLYLLNGQASAWLETKLKTKTEKNCKACIIKQGAGEGCSQAGLGWCEGG